MKETRRNIMVGLFVILGLAVLGWLVIKFGDLPTLVHRVDAHHITIYFPEAPGVQENTNVLFCGYPVGHVTSVKPPELLADLNNPEQSYYQVTVVVSIGKQHRIPKNTRAKIFRRGLGTSFLQFVLDGPPSSELLSDGDQLQGIVSEAGEFISESTQRRLDELIGSLTHLSDQLQGQLAPLTPAQVDQAEPNQVSPNITTAVMRLDQALKNVNIIIGDRENQQNIKQGLAGFSILIGEMRQGVKHLQDFSDQAAKLTEKTSKTIENIDGLTGQTQSFLTQITPKMQNVTDELARVLDHFNDLLRQMSSGQGTAGRILSDPKLYEELTNTTVNLNNAIGELRTLMAHWKEHGILYKEK